MNTLKITQIGNSLGVILPKEFLAKMKLAQVGGQPVEQDADREVDAREREEHRHQAGLLVNASCVAFTPAARSLLPYNRPSNASGSLSALTIVGGSQTVPFVAGDAEAAAAPEPKLPNSSTP